jgi:S1-C subfamily serine protease
MSGRKWGLCAMALVLLTFTACTAPPSESLRGSPGLSIGTTPTTLPTTARLLAEARGFAFRVRNVNCDATGSSFATSAGIVTNRHVASGSESLQLSTWSGNDFNATVQSISEMPGPDLAIVGGGSPQGLATLDTGDTPSGSQVWAAGYPDGDQLSVLPGVVLDYIDGAIYGAPGSIMEITNAVQPGSSGSPLLNDQGDVVGVVFAVNKITGNGLAIPISTLTQYLNMPGADTGGQCIA